MKPLSARSYWTIFEHLVASSREFLSLNPSSMKAKMRIPNERQCLMLNTFRTLVNTKGEDERPKTKTVNTKYLI